MTLPQDDSCPVCGTNCGNLNPYDCEVLTGEEREERDGPEAFDPTYVPAGLDDDEEPDRTIQEILDNE